jgi:tetratricopeptide (TPR) repeat protein
MRGALHAPCFEELVLTKQPSSRHVTRRAGARLPTLVARVLRVLPGFFFASASLSVAEAQAPEEGGEPTDPLVVAEPVDAANDYDDATARTHFEAGQNHYDAGAYDQAIVEFEAALALSPRPDMLYNLYLACERAGRLDDSVRYLERYLAEGEIDASDRTMLESRLANLRARAANEQAEERAPIARGPSAAWYGSLVGFSVGGAGAALFAVFASLSEIEDQSLADECAAGCGDERLSDLDTFNLVADIGLGIGVAGLTAGLVFLIVELASGGDDDVAASPFGAEIRF